MGKFGLIGKLTFLQNWTSNIVAKFNPAVYHKVQKYIAINKAVYLSALEQIKGDYYEFGVYTGSSFSHAIRCCSANEKLDDGLKKTNFFGFDSFEGFGEHNDQGRHSFYIDKNFKTDFIKVQVG